ncbi:MAG TPA: ABC transporter substrate-binding protein, partial [Lachnospiraceae bacterium]|nr:ABC transporter substrate-binding protein [Lachnospiraceae bacterium]
MSQKMRSRLITLLVIVGVILFFVIRSKMGNDKVTGGNSRVDYSTEYGKYMSAYKDSARPDDVITINGADFTSYKEEDKDVKPEIRDNYEGFDGKSVLTSEDGTITYTFEVKKEGIYELSLDYYPVEGKNSEIQRSFYIDGEQPYKELNIVQFSRIWTTDIAKNAFDNGETTVKWNKDTQGNEMKPTSIEEPRWINSYLYDNNGYITTPLSFYLSAGKHTVTIESKREPMLIGRLTFSNSKSLNNYAQQKAEWDAEGASYVNDTMVIIEGEDARNTSSQTLYPKQDQSSPALSPSSAKYLLNNTIGGQSWDKSGQWIEWEFEIPESGYYEISLFDKQNFMRGIYVSRKIYIDGKVPFQEMESYGFYYDSSWRLDTLKDSSDVPYKFYFEKGRHTLKMEVVLGEFSDVIAEVQDSVNKLNAIYRSVIRIIGVSPDTYRDYQIEASIPHIVDDLKEVKYELDDAINTLRAAVGHSSDKETVLITMRDQLEYLIDDVEHFVRVISTYKTNVRACGTWLTQVISQPLQIDRIYITSSAEDIDIAHNNFGSKFLNEMKRLGYSFVIDYNSMGATSNSKDNPTITLWVGTGRDQANVIRSLIDESFTSVYNINVNVQLVDMNTLLRAELAGEGPDVAIQVANTNGIAGAVLNTGNDTPVNYGLRDAVLDLNQFEDVNEVKKRFYDSALTAFSFDGSLYALPETMTFPVMFYRKDILADLGLEIPETWDDVNVIMTVLAKNQMEFGMLPSEQIFAMLLYQNGGKYYNEGGISSALDSDVAVNTFKQYCEFYTDYGLDKTTSVEERFRTGECPI